jgi:hypothetical protein
MKKESVKIRSETPVSATNCLQTFQEKVIELILENHVEIDLTDFNIGIAPKSPFSKRLPFDMKT